MHQLHLYVGIRYFWGGGQGADLPPSPLGSGPPETH